MNNKGGGKRNVVLVILCVVLVALLGIMMYAEKRSEKAQQRLAEEVAEQVKPYEEELKQIKEDLEEHERNVTFTRETAQVMVGFANVEKRDVDYIESLAEEYEFLPVLLADCCDSWSNVKALIDIAEDAEWEIMLTASEFSENANETALEAIAYIEEAGAKQAGVFLLRNDDYTTKNTQMLIEDGFAGYTKYNQSIPETGVTDDGDVYFDYSYIQSMRTVVKDRLAEMCSNKSALIIVFDMAAIREETVTEEYVEELLELLTEYAEDGKCEFASVGKTVEDLVEAGKTDEEKLAEYEEYAAGKQERIDELEQKIQEIYNQMG